MQHLMQYQGIVRLKSKHGDSADTIQLAAEFGPPVHYNAQLFDESLKKPLLMSSYIHIPQELLESTIHNRMSDDNTIDTSGDTQIICAYNEMMILYTALQHGVIQAFEIPEETRIPVSYPRRTSFGEFLRNNPHVSAKPVGETIGQSPAFLLEMMFLSTEKNHLMHQDILANKEYEESLVPL